MHVKTYLLLDGGGDLGVAAAEVGDGPGRGAPPQPAYRQIHRLHRPALGLLPKACRGRIEGVG